MNTAVFPRYPVLLVDDEEQALDSFEMALCSHGINNIISCKDSREAGRILKSEEIEVILLDLGMPHVTGEQLLREITCNPAEIPTIVVTGFDEVQRAVDCMRCGAFDYIVKPVEGSRLAAGVKRAIEIRELRRENSLLKTHLLSDALRHPEAFAEIVTNNRDMLAIFKYVEAIAETSRGVFVTGETGTGKELIVRAVHTLSRRKGVTVAVNVAGLDDNMFSDTLFGHQKGSFTGATRFRGGLTQKAAGGTLFLDEIGDLSISSQVKLLRLLQEEEYMSLGADEPTRSTVRIIATTSQDISAFQKAGKFRSDLFYRLQTHHIHLPPLRARMDDDLALLVDHFLSRSARKLGKKKPTPPGELLPLLRTYDFPGNVRELEAMIFDAVSRHESKMLSMASIRAHVFARTASGDAGAPDRSGTSHPLAFPGFLPTLKQTTQLLIEEALKRSGGNQTLAARMLGISAQALNQRLKRAAGG